MNYDIIGDEYLIGDDDIEALLMDDEVGAAIRARRGAGLSRAPRVASGALQRAMARKRAAAGKILTSSPPTQAREYPLGFDSGAAGVAAGANVLITSRPQELFKPRRLVLSTAAAPSFLINDILVGNRSQLVAAGALPGDAFRPDAVDISLNCDVAQVSQDVTLSVTNITAAVQRFNAALIGDVLQ